MHNQGSSLGWRHRLAVVAFTLLLGGEAYARPNTIVIEFSGVFDNCPPGGNSVDCPAPDLAVLLQTEFRGEIRIPVTEDEAVSSDVFFADWPSYSERGIYQFALSDASFQLETAYDRFDLDGTVPPTILINDCLEGISCPRKDDWLRIWVETDEYLYEVVVCCALVPGELDGVGIPDVSWIDAATTYGTMSITSLDFTSFVSPKLVFPSPWVTSVYVVSSDSLELTPIPLMPFLYSAILCGVTVIIGVMGSRLLRRASAT